MHVATAPSVVRNFVLLQPGEPCSEFLVRETARVLRAQPFLADASVATVADGDSVRIEVVTVDEPAVVGSIGLTNTAPFLRALTFGNANLEGKGIYAVAGWREGHFYRDTFLGRYTNYQLFRRPYQLQVRAARFDHGYDVATSVSYPFFTDAQPRAWRVSGGGSEDLVPFRSPGRPVLGVGLHRAYFDMGAGVRVGAAGHLGLIGASFSAEATTPEIGPVLVTDSGVVADTTSALMDRFSSYHATRLNLLLGYRQVNFLRVVGFDALNGVQDVRRGFQLGLTVGRGLGIGGRSRSDWFTAATLYGGVGSPTTFAAVELGAEGRRNADTRHARGVLVSGRLGWYLKPHRRHTVVGSVEFAGAWRQELPFQLSLGDGRGGVRGYGDARLGGGERLVARAEERWRVGTIRGTADAGVAFFIDGGKLWAGDAALGRDTPWEPSVGVGILCAIPPGSQRLWRLDLAVPVRRDGGARWELRFSNGDHTRTFWTEPNDVRGIRERVIPASVFVWP